MSRTLHRLNMFSNAFKSRSHGLRFVLTSSNMVQQHCISSSVPWSSPTERISVSAQNTLRFSYLNPHQRSSCKTTSRVIQPQLGVKHSSSPGIIPLLPSRVSTGSLFHTSPRRDIHPLLLLIIKPVAKLTSILTGRWFRNWWKRQSPDDKAEFHGKLKKNRPYMLLAGGLLGVAGAIHFWTHIQETPITGRKRYVSLTHDQLMKIGEFEYNMQLTAVEGHILPSNNPSYQKVSRVVKRIVDANQDLDYMKKQTWTIIVVDQDEVNAFVLPTGHIFVYSGLLKFAESDQQLAVVLGHEMAHALLSHAAEHVSYAAVVDAIVVIVMAAIWAFMPTDGIAIVAQWFYDKVMEISLHLPYSRKLEQEADEVGLELIAKACFDVRWTSAFWNARSLDPLQKDSDNPETELVAPQWLSTHPANETRADCLDQLIPRAIVIRDSCNCPPLPKEDPRQSIADLRTFLETAKTATVGTQVGPPTPLKQDISKLAAILTIS